MIQKCLIQREMAKKIRRQMAVFADSGGFAASSLQFLINIINATAIPQLTEINK